MIRTVKIRKCGKQGDILIGVHGHLVVDGEEVTMVQSLHELRELVQKRIASGHLLSDEAPLFDDAINAAATWLPLEAPHNTMASAIGEAMAGSMSPQDFMGQLQGVFEQKVAPVLRQQERRQQEADRRLMEHLRGRYRKPSLRLYKAADGEVLGMVCVFGLQHSIVSDMDGFHDIVKDAVDHGDGVADNADFSDIYKSLIKARFQFKKDGELAEGFEVFTEVNGNDKIGRLVDSKGFKIVSCTKLGLLQSLTGARDEGQCFTQEKVGELIEAVMGSNLPMTLLTDVKFVDLGDGYKASLHYAGDQLVVATATYDPPQVPAPVTGADAPALADGQPPIAEPPPAAAPVEEECDHSLEAASS